MFIAMNRFQVNAGKESDFEEMWRNRETYLNQVDGFVSFSLLKNASPDGGVTEYISHSTWQSREHFEAWTNSEAFTRGHAGGGSVAGVLAGPPQVSLYQAVLTQDKQPAKA